jgi:hypothetical protein
MELLVPAAFPIIGLAIGLALAVQRNELRTLLLLLIPSVVGCITYLVNLAAPGSWVSICGLIATAWGMMLAAYLLRSSFAVAILLAPGAVVLPICLAFFSGLH